MYSLEIAFTPLGFSEPQLKNKHFCRKTTVLLTFPILSLPLVAPSTRRISARQPKLTFCRIVGIRLHWFEIVRKFGQIFGEQVAGGRRWRRLHVQNRLAFSTAKAARQFHRLIVARRVQLLQVLSVLRENSGPRERRIHSDAAAEILPRQAVSQHHPKATSRVHPTNAALVTTQIHRRDSPRFAHPFAAIHFESAEKKAKKKRVKLVNCLNILVLRTYPLLLNDSSKYRSNAPNFTRRINICTYINKLKIKNSFLHNYKHSNKHF